MCPVYKGTFSVPSIFDEPFSGFDPINANLLRDEIIRLKNNGSTVIFSTHNMASVEEICDNITLINNGKNILSGNVEQLRREFSQGRYSLGFKGNPRTLMETLAPMTQAMQLSDNLDSLQFQLNSDVTLRDVISSANPIVEISSLQPSMASMNDIFIHTVENNNRN